MSEKTYGKKYAVIIGAGPAGLTAAYELLRQTNIVPLVYEKSGDFGGILQTVNYKGNRIDIGGHRFFSKSDRVMDWWTKILLVESDTAEVPGFSKHYHAKDRTITAGKQADDRTDNDLVMRVRNRISRIFFSRKFFDYPLSINLNTLRNLGFRRLLRVSFSYVLSAIHQIKQEATLEDFIVNRFGRELYLTFFKDYTEKVWGVSCNKIDASWGAQRIKGLSITKALLHALKSMFGGTGSSIKQYNTETSLIERFLYPKYGPGQMWEEVTRQVVNMGGKIILHRNAKTIKVEDNRALSVTFISTCSDEAETVEVDYLFSIMPMR
jgi:protoporphyrinogen oxidase